MRALLSKTDVAAVAAVANAADSVCPSLARNVAAVVVAAVVVAAVVAASARQSTLAEFRTIRCGSWIRSMTSRLPET